MNNNVQELKTFEELKVEVANELRALATTQSHDVKTRNSMPGNPSPACTSYSRWTVSPTNDRGSYKDLGLRQSRKGKIYVPYHYWNLYNFWYYDYANIMHYDLSWPDEPPIEHLKVSCEGERHVESPQVHINIIDTEIDGMFNTHQLKGQRYQTLIDIKRMLETRGQV
jgi:hypothetical protein